MRFCWVLSALGLLSACNQPPIPPDRPAAVVVPGTLPEAPAPRPAAPPAAPGKGIAGRPDVQAFIREMASRHGFNPVGLNSLFNRVTIQPSIIAAMERPAEKTKPWYAYRQNFITPKRIQDGATFWRTHERALARAEQIYGVPAEIIVAIIGVETSYGGFTGKFRVIDALSTLAFNYPRRADYFRKELENYLLLTRDEGIDPLSLRGSYAGAMGYGQFMPGSYRSFAVDFDGDGRRDLWNNAADAIGSVANYLSGNRWQRDQPIAMPAVVEGDGYQDLISPKPQPPQRSISSFRQQGISPQEMVNDDQKAIFLQLQGSDGREYWLGFENFYAITRYNPSVLYAMAVYQLGESIRERKGRV